MSITIFIQLLLAHILADFVFQTNSMVKNKKSAGLMSLHFWYHILLSGALTYIILMRWCNVEVPLFIIITHGFLDYWKIRQEAKIDTYNSQQQNSSNKKTATRPFLLDQFFHLLVILIAWLYLTSSFNQIIPFIKALVSDISNLTIVTALTLIIWPVGLAIGKITEPFRNELTPNQDDSLSKAGTYIGVFERILTFIFVMLGQFAAIGFLIAAKSVLRISKDGETEARKKTEYVLIGTLMSFTMAIIIGLATKCIIKCYTL